MANVISKDQIEQVLLKTLAQQYGYTTLNCFTINAENLNDHSNRLSKRDVILPDQLFVAAQPPEPANPGSLI